MSLYACGLNAHGQLSDDSYNDISVLQEIHNPNTGSNVSVFFAGWSETICKNYRTLLLHLTPEC